MAGVDARAAALPAKTGSELFHNRSMNHRIYIRQNFRIRDQVNEQRFIVKNPVETDIVFTMGSCSRQRQRLHCSLFPHIKTIVHSFQIIGLNRIFYDQITADVEEIFFLGSHDCCSGVLV